jgi:hypothetical protein
MGNRGRVADSWDRTGVSTPGRGPIVSPISPIGSPMISSKICLIVIVREVISGIPRRVSMRPGMIAFITKLWRRVVIRDERESGMTL